MHRYFNWEFVPLDVFFVWTFSFVWSVKMAIFFTSWAARNAIIVVGSVPIPMKRIVQPVIKGIF